MVIGFTGTRQGMTEPQKALLLNLLQKYNTTEVHHGDCIGADSQFHDLILDYFPTCKIVIHPPEKTKAQAFRTGELVVRLDTKDYLDRNHDIVDACEVLMACPKEPEHEVHRSGTWATVRYARKIGRIINIIRP